MEPKKNEKKNGKFTNNTKTPCFYFNVRRNNNIY